MQTLMHLKVLLPFEVHSESTDVLRIVAESQEGSFGILPHRRDCLAILKPGILIFETKSDGELYLAVDEGTLVKNGLKVFVSVRRAILGSSLAKLRDSVQQEFLTINEEELQIRSVMTKLESSLVRRLMDYKHE